MLSVMFHPFLPPSIDDCDLEFDPDFDLDDNGPLLGCEEDPEWTHYDMGDNGPPFGHEDDPEWNHDRYGDTLLTREG